MKILLLLTIVLPYICCQNTLGGQEIVEINLDDANVVFAVQAINDILKAFGDARTRTAVKIVSVSSQIVAGVLYKLQIEVTGGDQNEICNVTVWSRPWLNGEDARQIVDAPLCVKKTKKDALGGQVAIALSDPELQGVLNFVEKRVNERSNNYFYLKVTGAGTATKQVVNGVIYRFKDVAFSESTCTKNDVGRDPNALCTIPADRRPITRCSADVYWNPRSDPVYQASNEDCLK